MNWNTQIYNPLHTIPILAQNFKQLLYVHIVEKIMVLSALALKYRMKEKITSYRDARG